MRVLIEAGPLMLAWDDTSPRRAEIDSARSTSPVRVDPDTTAPGEMWVIDRRVVEQWLTLAADRGPGGVQELMIELDLADADDGQAA